MEIEHSERNLKTTQQSAESYSDSDRSTFDAENVLRPSLIVLSYLVFFLSGAAALIYEISWSRQIGLLFGHTVHAAAVVLGCYFSGMAVGYLTGARWSSRLSPLLGYGIAELVVAGWAFLIPTLLSWSESPMIAAWLSNPSFVWQTIIRVVFCFLLLLPATIALGVTLPMMAQFLSDQRRCDIADTTNATRVTLAYALNTAGALVGVLSATFFLLVVVGVRTSSYVAAGISIMCAIVAFAMTRWCQAGEMSSKAALLEEVHKSAPLVSRSSKIWFLLALLSGFGTLALEVLYTRMFSLVFHNSTYTFGAVVAVFLGSLALGAALASWLQRHYTLEGLAGWASGLGALATTTSVIIFIALTDLDYYSYGESFLQYMAGAFFIVSVVVAPPITLLGILLPLVWKAIGRDHSAGRVIGRMTAINTIAAAVGALAASFLLLPWVGLWQSFVLVAVLFYIVGSVLLLRHGLPTLVYGGAVILLGLSIGALRCPIEADYNRTPLNEQLVQRWNSPYGWIDVVRLTDTGSMKIRQNLHYRFGKTGDNAREYRQAHIPLLLHQQPSDVLFLGLGTGLTAGGAIPHREVENIVTVELIPEVVEAARLLRDYNYNVVDHEKAEVRIDDARHYLLATDRRFDVIVSDMFVPWESETGYLYTVEHYRVAQKRLKQDGLFCQWLPLYQLGTREFELIADSFASVFPETTIWWGQMDPSKPVVALIGANSPLKIDPDRLATFWRNPDSSDENLRTLERFHNNYIGDWVSRNPSRLNTDEHPRVEFLTPISNRNRTMIKRSVLEEYYNEILSKLPSRAVRIQNEGDEQPQETKQRRAWQRLILFGL